MGFEMSAWDGKLLKYGDLLEKEIMDLRLNLPLDDALDQCWQILAQCFAREEIGIRMTIIEKHWPGEVQQSAEAG